MKRLTTYAGVATLGLCVAFAAMPAAADDEAKQNVRKQDRVQAGKLDDKTSGTNIRASKLIGMDIKNSQGKDLGDIHDVVLDTHSGMIEYAAVSYGGFLGLGDKLFAVPWAAFKWQRGEDEDDFHLVLDVQEKQLKTAQGFDKDNWPDFADAKFTAEIYRFYRIEQPKKQRGDKLDKLDKRDKRDKDDAVDRNRNKENE